MNLSWIHLHKVVRAGIIGVFAKRHSKTGRRKRPGGSEVRGGEGVGGWMGWWGSIWGGPGWKVAKTGRRKQEKPFFSFFPPTPFPLQPRLQPLDTLDFLPLQLPETSHRPQVFYPCRVGESDRKPSRVTENLVIDCGRLVHPSCRHLSGGRLECFSPSRSQSPTQFACSSYRFSIRRPVSRAERESSLLILIACEELASLQIRSS